MNDLEKLNRVVSSLEEQATQVVEFKGILQAVNDARLGIEASNAALASLSDEHKQLIKDSYGKFDDLEKRLADLGKKFVDLAKGQDSAQRTISELKILTPDQFEQGQDKILLKLSEFNILTPAQYEEGCRANKEAFNLSLSELAQRIEQTSQLHQASLSSLKAVTMLGMLALAGSIAYLAYHLLY